MASDKKTFVYDNDDLLMNYLKLNERSLRKELDNALRLLAKRPTAWFRLEAVGRCLRWLGDEAASEYFLKATTRFNPENLDTWQFIMLGNLYRLAGDEESANQIFLRAFDILQTRISSENSLEQKTEAIDRLIPVAFMLNEFEQAVKLSDYLSESVPHEDEYTQSYQFGKLARAVKDQNVEYAEEAVEGFASMIRSENARISDTGGITLWDAYEIACDTLNSLKQSE